MDSLALFHRFTNSQGPAPLIEAWGDVVPTYDSGWWDDSGSGFGSTLARYQRPATTLYDRNDGRFLPVYQTEFDLAVIRAMGRTLAVVAPGLVGGMRNLCNYTIGEGFTFTATREATACIGDEEAGPLVQAIQTELNSLLDDNEFVSGLDREIHDCSIVDGESLLHVRPNAGGKVRIYRREPNELRQPANTRELEEWVQDAYGIDCESFVSSWSFGVHTRADQPDEPLGYHLVADESGVNWEYVPADRMVHIKRNVTRNAKRGFSDFYPVEPDSARGEKLRRNMAEGAAVQSAIAFVRQHIAGTTRVGVEAMLGDNKTGTSRQPTGAGGSRSRNVVQYQPGTVVDLSAGLEYKAGPLGSERASDFLLVAAYVQRMQAVRWSMPEYMFSGDASNANYASTMEATAPFVKSCEAEQRFYSKHFVSLLWKALKIRWEMGAFDQFDIAWEDLVAWIKIKAECPEVATRDELQNVQRQEILIKLGILSRKTAATQNGLDYEAEVANGAAAEGQEGKGGEGGPPGAPGGEGGSSVPTAGPLGAAPCECEGESADAEDDEANDEELVPESFVETTPAAVIARESQKPPSDSVLLECGGKGGKPGPCALNRSEVKAPRERQGKKSAPTSKKRVRATSKDSVRQPQSRSSVKKAQLSKVARAPAKAAKASAVAQQKDKKARSENARKVVQPDDVKGTQARERTKRREPRTKVTGKKAAATRKDNPNTKRRQDYAQKVVEQTAKGMKGTDVIPDNAPADLRAQTVVNGKVRVDYYEHKTILDRKSNSVSGTKSAMERKARVAADTGREFHMLIADKRDVFEKGKHKARFTEKYYYKRGGYSGTLDKVYVAKSPAHMKRLSLMPDHKLPLKAQADPRWIAVREAAKKDKTLGALVSSKAKMHQERANKVTMVPKKASSKPGSKRNVKATRKKGRK